VLEVGGLDCVAHLVAKGLRLETAVVEIIAERSHEEHFEGEVEQRSNSEF
jgi:hypothetical protein